MATPHLTVHNAEIKTATVEIKTLTVSGKQVTLAVFRQLRRAPLIAEDGTLNGTPWGIVNYHPDKCDGPGQHLHVVWQRDSELYRSNIWLDLRWSWFRPATADSFAAAAYCASGHKFPAWASKTYAASGSESELRFDLDDVPCMAAIPPRCDAQAYVRPDGTRMDAPPCQASADVAALREALNAEVAEEKARRARHHAAVKELTALPQLFIAV